ncbi:MAG: Spy/CpxP family protein refolding chaperone [Gemmatimonadetes bacterium]|nr:Spy/CpxP family protein refolding chaperone [Gemmatimonadota bacterium]
MKLLRWTALAATAIALVACDNAPTTPDNLQASFDEIDPVVVTFAATQGLPGGPFGERGGAPFMAGMPFGRAPASASNGRGPGAALPDELKLTVEQKAQITVLVTAFRAANTDDIAAMKAAHTAARTARQGGASRDDVKTILEGAKPAAERVRAAAAALRTAIQGVLTQAQREWLEAHRPEHPPRTP